MNIKDYLPNTCSTISYIGEEQWLEERRKGIGGSDVAVVMGLNKYKSELRLYKEKVEHFKEDTSDNVYIKKGKDLEDLIRLKYVTPHLLEKGYTLIHPDVMLVNSKNPIFRANLDGFAVPMEFDGNCSKNIVVEIKWVSEFGQSNWDGDEYFGVPVNYYAQVQEYMYVTEAKSAIICALFDSDWSMHYYEIPYDSDFIAKMVLEAERFMNVHVKYRIAPKPDASKDKSEILRALKESEKTPTWTDEAIENRLVEYKELKQQAKEIEGKMDNAYNEIVSKYIEGWRPSSPFNKITMSVVNKTNFDTTRFAKDNPTLYNQYITQTQYTRTVIK